MALKLADVLMYLGADDKGLETDLAGAKGKTESWASRVGGSVNTLLTGAVVGGALAAAGAVVAIGTAAFDVSRETEKAAASMAASLGLPREEAEKFAEVAKRVYGNNFADSVEEAGKAVTEVTKLLKLGADDPSLQKITEKAIALKDTFDTDVNESVSTARTLMENFGLSADQAFDLITKGYQKGLDRSGDFVDSINEYSTQFANGGATAQEFFGLMEAGLAGGALGTDKAADAFKEFRVRILDGSDATKDALEQIGLNANDITSQIDSGSMTIADAWNLVIGKLKETEDQSILMQAGVGLIGTQFEDLGQEAVLNMQMTQDAFADAAGATDALNAKYETFGDAATGIWRRLVVSVTPLTDKLLDMANAAIPYLTNAFDVFDKKVLPGLIAFGADVGEMVKNLVPVFGEWIAVLIDLGKYFASAVTWGGPVNDFLANLPNPIQGVVWAIGQLIEILSNLGRYLFATVDTGGDYLNDWITHLPEPMRDVTIAVGKLIGFIYELFTGKLKTTLEGGTGYFTYFADWINTNFPLVQALIERVLNAIRAFWDDNGAAIMNIVTNTFSTIWTIIDTALKTIMDLVTVVLQLLNGDFEGAATTFVGIISRLWTTIKEIFSTSLANLRELVLGIDWLGLGGSIIRGIGNGIKTGAGFLYEVLKQGLQSALDGVASFFGIGGAAAGSEGGGRSLGELGRSAVSDMGRSVGRLAQPSVGPLAASVGSAGGGTFNITIQNTFNGPADEIAVKRGTETGIVSAMRSLGLR